MNLLKIFAYVAKYKCLPSLGHDGVTHIEVSTVASVVPNFIYVVASAANKSVRVPDSGGEEVWCTSMRAGAGRAARLSVSAAVGVEVGVGDGVEDTVPSSVGVDGLNV